MEINVFTFGRVGRYKSNVEMLFPIDRLENAGATTYF